MTFPLTVAISGIKSSLNMPTLEQGRNKARLITMYKIITGSLDVPSSNFSPNQCPSRYFNQPH